MDQAAHAIGIVRGSSGDEVQAAQLRQRIETFRPERLQRARQLGRRELITHTFQPSGQMRTASGSISKRQTLPGGGSI
jgi:hypothetical protein